jgi:hypothetical protein
MTKIFHDDMQHPKLFSALFFKRLELVSLQIEYIAADSQRFPETLLFQTFRPLKQSFGFNETIHIIIHDFKKERLLQLL